MHKIIIGLLAILASCTVVSAQAGEVIGHHCSGIPVVLNANHSLPPGASATMMAPDFKRRHTVVTQAFFKGGEALARFQMAHECEHHIRHLKNTSADWARSPGDLSERALVRQRARLHAEEMEADCSATRKLMANGDR